ncbi:hypothetical protein TWF730_007083 [Orbilia blumenaviensis]|uniref:Uncharacterized protein n=1 Tax=Orbilia blumenaviensis TaxID=1796055 RepID=A0AAV9VGP0_9PEZI
MSESRGSLTPVSSFDSNQGDEYTPLINNYMPHIIIYSANSYSDDGWDPPKVDLVPMDVNMVPQTASFRST